MFRRSLHVRMKSGDNYFFKDKEVDLFFDELENNSGQFLSMTISDPRIVSPF